MYPIRSSFFPFFNGANLVAVGNVGQMNDILAATTPRFNALIPAMQNVALQSLGAPQPSYPGTSIILPPVPAYSQTAPDPNFDLFNRALWQGRLGLAAFENPDEGINNPDPQHDPNLIPTAWSRIGCSRAARRAIDAVFGTTPVAASVTVPNAVIIRSDEVRAIGGTFVQQGDQVITYLPLTAGTLLIRRYLTPDEITQLNALYQANIHLNGVAGGAAFTGSPSGSGSGSTPPIYLPAAIPVNNR